MLSRNSIVVFFIFVIITLLSSGCKKCYTCKYEYREYLFYKGSDTLTIIADNNSMQQKIIELQDLDYIILSKVNDSLYFEDICDVNNKHLLEANGKAYCFPKK